MSPRYRMLLKETETDVVFNYKMGLKINTITMATKAFCTRINFSFDDGHEVVWWPADKSKPSGGNAVAVKFKDETGGISWSTNYPGPASIRQSLHLIKVAKKRNYRKD